MTLKDVKKVISLIHLERDQGRHLIRTTGVAMNEKNKITSSEEGSQSKLRFAMTGGVPRWGLRSFPDPTLSSGQVGSYVTVRLRKATSTRIATLTPSVCYGKWSLLYMKMLKVRLHSFTRTN